MFPIRIWYDLKKERRSIAFQFTTGAMPGGGQMAKQLNKRERMWFCKGPIYHLSNPIGYVVESMPAAQRAFISNFGVPSRPDTAQWKILRIQQGVQGDWNGDFATADEALASLQTQS